MLMEEEKIKLKERHKLESRKYYLKYVVIFIDLPLH